MKRKKEAKQGGENEKEIFDLAGRKRVAKNNQST